MRRSRFLVLILLGVLVLGLAAPSAGSEGGQGPHSRYHGLYFPAGMPGTDTDCPDPYKWQDMPPMCVIDPGTPTVLPDGRVQIREMEVYELALAYRANGVVEPRKTGYDVVVATAILDDTFSGPTWGTWDFYSFGADPANPADDFVMFSGVYFGRFKNGIPGVHFFGLGEGIYEGQYMGGFIRRAPNTDGWNMFGQILDLG